MDAIALIIEPRERPVGNSIVHRLLPWRLRRMVGPFIFADHMGPEDLPPGIGVDVDAHPHIGLSTLTYLFEGRIVHRNGGVGMYGHCVLEVEATGPGSGFVFENAVVGGAIPKQYISNIEAGVKELLQRINDWKDAPVWTPDAIQEATKDWFKFLSPVK